MERITKQSNQSLQDYLDKQEEVQQESFMVDTEEKANWALRKISCINEQIKNNENLANTEKKKIDMWEAEVNGQLKRDTDYFIGLIQQYALSKRETDENFKTAKLPYGSYGFHKQQPVWKLDDEKIIPALRNMGADELIKVVETPKLAEIKKKFNIAGIGVADKETGELLEGIKITQRDDKFVIAAE